MIEKCIRCGKEKHGGKCLFDKTKKSMVEIIKDKSDSTAVDVSDLKKKVK